MVRFTPMRMQNQIFFSFLLLIAIPTMVLFAAIAFVYSQALENRTINAGELVVKESVKRIDTLLNEYREASMQVYYNDSVMDLLYNSSREGTLSVESRTAISKVLASIVNADKYLMTAVLSTKSGLIVEGTDIPDIEAFMENHLEEANRIPGRLIWVPTTELKSVFGLTSLYFGGMRLIRRESVEIGRLLFLIREDFFDDIYAGAIPSNSGNDLVVSSLGTVISSSDKTLIGRRLEDSYITEITENRLGAQGHFVSKTPQGRLHHIFARSKESGWYFIRKLDDEEIFAGVVRVRQSLAGIMVLYSIFLGVMSFLLSRGLGRPLRNLTSSVDRIGTETMDIPRSKNRFTGDEVRSLEDSLTQMIRRIQTLIDDVSREERARNQAELKALRNHISPHFVYNALDTIRWMAMINKQENIKDTVTALDKLLRYAADTERVLITLEEELDIVREYVLIQNMRYPDIVMKSSVPEDLLGLKMNKFILQTIVENSIVHGFGNLDATKVVEIHAARENDFLILTVRDNGCGFDSSAMNRDERPHTGLTNVNMRLKLNYGTAYRARIRSAPGKGTDVDLKLPVLE